MALVNLDAVEAWVTDEDCPDGLMTHNIKGKITIRGEKSLHWACGTHNVLRFRFPGFNRRYENAFSPDSDGIFRSMPKTEYFSLDELKKKEEPIAYQWPHTP